DSVLLQRLGRWARALTKGVRQRRKASKWLGGPSLRGSMMAGMCSPPRLPVKFRGTGQSPENTQVGSDDERKSYADPTDEVCDYLHPDWRHCFTFRTWEQLYAAVISGDPNLASLDGYLHNKSAH